MLKTIRELVLKAVDGLNDQQLLQIPEGYKNNIAWNLGHIIATQQILSYTLSRLDMRIPKEMAGMYRTGTDPNRWNSTPDINNLKSILISLTDEFLNDYKSGIFKDFRPYKTATGVQLGSLQDAINFNYFHEGVHTGIILSMIKHI
jgi:hypothetical protein